MQRQRRSSIVSRCGAPLRVAPAALLLAVACTDQGDRASLLALLDNERAAHLTADASLLVQSIADTLLTVDAGVVRRQARDEVEASFRDYFSGARYSEWSDVEPPVIRLSADGSLAHVTRVVISDREAPAFGGGRERERFQSAWTATYEHSAGRWRMTSVTSTFLEGPAAAAVVAGALRRLSADGVPRLPGMVRFDASARGPGGEFDVSVQSAADRSLRIDFPPGFSAAITRDDAWLLARPGEPPGPLGDTLISYVRGHDLIMNLLDPESRVGPLHHAGLEEFDGQPALRLHGLDALGGPVELYYAARDTLPLGYRVVDHLRGQGPVTVTVSDWQLVGNVRLPQFAVFTQGAERFEYRMRLQASEVVDPAAFLRPGA